MIRTQHSANPRDPTTIADYPTSSSMVATATAEAVESSASAAADAARSAAASINGFDLINHAIRMGSASSASGLVSFKEESSLSSSLSSSKAGHSLSQSQREQHELLLKAHHQLLERQQRQQRNGSFDGNGATAAALAAAASGAASSISRVSSASSTMGHHLGLSHSHASELAAAAAAAKQQQQQHAQQQKHANGNNLGWASQGGGIVAALQRRHRQPSDVQPSQRRFVPYYLGVEGASGTQQAAPAATHKTGSATELFAAQQQPQQQQPPTTSSTGGATTGITASHSQDEQNARQLNPNAFQFPWKLHDMLDRSTSEGNEDVVSWVDNGEAFRVHLPDVFVEHIMPRFFKQTKYKSVSNIQTILP